KGRRMHSAIERSAAAHFVRPGWVAPILYTPVLLLGGSFALLGREATRPAMRWMLREDGPIEDLTAAFLFVGGLISLRLALALRTREEPPLISWFYMTFALGVLLVAME